MEEGGKKIEVHLGNYFYPLNKRKWEAEMGKGEEWDIRSKGGAHMG